MNPIALRKANIAYNFGLSECSKVKRKTSVLSKDKKDNIFGIIVLFLNRENAF